MPELPRLSRSAQSSPWGKCDRRLETALPAAVDDAVTVEATLRRMTKSEVVREILTERYMGKLDMLRHAAGLDTRCPAGESPDYDRG